MRVAALYDIHANLPALEAVLDDVRQVGVDQVVVGGDVLPGPMPCQALARLVDLGPSVRFIVGNGDREVLAQLRGIETDWFRSAPEAWREPVRWSAQQLGAGYEQLLASWPATCALEVPKLGRTVFCHGTPRSDTELFTLLTPEERLLPVFGALDADVAVCGHTHMQFDRTVGRVRVVNAGSVGMPFGEPGAHWLLLGPAVEMRRTAYDLEGAAGRIRATSYPQAEQFAADNVLQPPPERKMLEAFGRAELG
jgi:predicted phosphodiesterase